MTSQMIVLLVAYTAAVLLLALPMGRWLAAVAEGKLAGLQRFDGAVLRACGARPGQEQGWKGYAIALLLFNAVGVLAVYALQRLQGMLPLNRPASPRCRPTRPSTPPSASSPTPTGRATRASRR